MSELAGEIQKLKDWILGLDSVPWEDQVNEKFKGIESLEKQMYK